jgi:predicted amidohydrolase YtcJ
MPTGGRRRRDGPNIDPEEGRVSNADMIFRGGPVVTVDPQNRIAQAVAVRGDRIVYVGDTAGADEWKGPRTRVVDLRGRTLLPGLIEAHCHIAGVGAFHRSINLKWPHVRSIEDVKFRVAEAARAQAPGSWIVGRGYNQLKLDEGRHPNRFDLDAAAPDHPVLLVRGCGHIAAVNSRALALAGITAATADPPGGLMDRDEHGAPLGVLRERAAEPVRRAADRTADQHRADYRLGCETLVKMGYTSAHEMGRPISIDLLQAWHGADGHQLRVFAVVSKVEDEALLPDVGGPLFFRMGDLRFRVGHYKLFADGSSSGPTAATRAPYATDPANRGIVIWPQDVVIESYVRANRLGFPVTAHAVGDRGIDIVLTGQEAALKDRPRAGLTAAARELAGVGVSAGGATDGGHRAGPTGRLPEMAATYGTSPRHRIEHCAMATPDLRRRIRAAGVIPIAQAVFLWEYGDGYLHDYGPERGAAMFPIRSLLREGIPVALSSDAPVTTAEPMRGLSVTLTRTSQTGQVVGPDERVGILDAIRCYTLHGAFAELSEDLKGSVEVGKLADLTLLGAPILDLTPDELIDVPTQMTVIGGRVAYEQS